MFEKMSRYDILTSSVNNRSNDLCRVILTLTEPSWILGAGGGGHTSTKRAYNDRIEMVPAIWHTMLF